MNSVVITGASQGFGYELLKAYMEKGWKVFPLVRKAEDAKAIGGKYPGNCYPIIGDVTSDGVGEKIAEILGRHTESLELLINNAGNIKKNRGFLGTNPEELVEHFNVHVVGVYRCTAAALPFLQKAEKPVIINVSSRWGSINRILGWEKSHIYSYQIAKCAQNMLSACLHQEYKKHNVKVFTIHPGRLKTAVAPFDADVEPRDAAVKLAGWIERVDDKTEFKFYDIMNDASFDW
jgi:NAD(P)-dependent dehydrogenase (short-subunit alcohol dehydrogenase family)